MYIHIHTYQHQKFHIFLEREGFRGKSEWSRAYPGPVPGPPCDSANNKQQGREGEGEGKGRKEREEGKERGREGTDVRHGKDGTYDEDDIDGQRRE
jgi:hypothetical protein